MNELDLNIQNYDLDDILNLFKLERNFDELQLKNAKKVVLMTHPDKSRLANEYFIFFAKAIFPACPGRAARMCIFKGTPTKARSPTMSSSL